MASSVRACRPAATSANRWISAGSSRVRLGPKSDSRPARSVARNRARTGSIKNGGPVCGLDPPSRSTIRKEPIVRGGESPGVSIRGQAHDLACIEFREAEINRHPLPEHADRLRICNFLDLLETGW